MEKPPTETRLRHAPELDYPGNPFRAHEAHELLTLRGFRDEAGTLRAGLYPGAQADQNDHWANGDTLTDDADAAIASNLAPVDTGIQLAGLRAVAYRRAKEQAAPDPRRVQIPDTMRPWTVRVNVLDRGDDVAPVDVPVMAETARAAEIAACIEMLDRAVRTATSLQK